MTTEEMHDHEYDWLVREDATTWRPSTDLTSLVDLGARRLRRRRQAIAAGAVGLVAAAVAVPALALGGTATEPVERGSAVPAPYAGTSSGPDDAPPPDPVTLRGCGWFTCAEGRQRPDTEPVLGDVMTIGTTPSGLEEVVWASERTLVDPATGSEVVGPVLMTGFVKGDVRVDGLFALQPGHEFAPECAMSFAYADIADGGWAVLGYVEGNHPSVLTDAGDDTRSSTTVLPGYTVFVAHGGGSVGTPMSFSAGDVSAPLAGCTSTG